MSWSRLTKWFIAWVALSFVFGGLAQAACKTRSNLVDNGSEMYDTETDLTWAKCSVGKNWVGGKCIGVATRGSWKQANEAKRPDGWRVPSPEELESIIVKNCEDPMHGTESDSYWTNRKDASGDYCLFLTNFPYGQRIFSAECDDRAVVRLVRAGQ